MADATGARRVRQGDVLVCTTPGDLFSRAIRWATRSDASHVALVTRADPAGGNFWLLEVGCTLREARIAEFPGREWIAYRPTTDAGPIAPEEGAVIVYQTLRFLAAAGALGALYPFWKLPAYLLGRDWRGRLILSGARQVCSVVTMRALAARGIALWAWEGDNRRRLDAADEIEGITPADVLRTAIEEGWIEVAWTDHAPVF